MEKFYNQTQVAKLLDDILNEIPINDNRFLKIRNFILNKKKNIDKHI